MQSQKIRDCWVGVAWYLKSQGSPYSLLVTLPTPGHHHGKCTNTLSPKVRHSGEGVKLAIILSLKTLVSEVSDQLNILPLKRRAQCDKADIEPVLKGIGKTWL